MTETDIWPLCRSPGEAPCPGSARSEAEGRDRREPLTGSFRGDTMPGVRRTVRAALAGAASGVRDGGVRPVAGAGERTWRQRPALVRGSARGSGPSCRPTSGEIPPATPTAYGTAPRDRPSNPPVLRALLRKPGRCRTARRAEGVPLKT
jgi:hypothetical protein